MCEREREREKEEGGRREPNYVQHPLVKQELRENPHLKDAAWHVRYGVGGTRAPMAPPERRERRERERDDVTWSDEVAHAPFPRPPDLQSKREEREKKERRKREEREKKERRKRERARYIVMRVYICPHLCPDLQPERLEPLPAGLGDVRTDD